MGRIYGIGGVVLFAVTACGANTSDDIPQGSGGFAARDSGAGGSQATGGANVGSGGAAGAGGVSASGGTACGWQDASTGDETGSEVDAGACTGGDVTWLSISSLPPALAVPAGAKLKSHDHGVGVQIYTCTANASTTGAPTTYAWTLKAPQAKLFDACGREVATHAAGPSWTSTVDGTAVQGAKVLQVDSPQSTAIPWLLLRAIANVGAGDFGDISYVQRLNTVGGKAPAAGCDATTVGAETEVAYSADYYFYTGGAGAAWLMPPQVPDALAVPSGASLKIHDHGVGAQIYTCTASGGVDGGAPSYAWVFKAPDAVLYDVVFANVGTHGAGPHWTSIDGSTVVASKLAQASAPLPDAIPWLLLGTSSTTGAGVFSDITYVQRLNTVGGQAPATGCDSTTVGTELRVGYSADYYFFSSGAVDGGVGG